MNIKNQQAEDEVHGSTKNRERQQAAQCSSPQRSNVQMVMAQKSAWSVTTTRKSIISCSVLVPRLGYSTAAARSLSSLTGLPIFAASNAITSKVPVGLPSRDK